MREDSYTTFILNLDLILESRKCFRDDLEKEKVIVKTFWWEIYIFIVNL